MVEVVLALKPGRGSSPQEKVWALPEKVSAPHILKRWRSIGLVGLVRRCWMVREVKWGRLVPADLQLPKIIFGTSYTTPGTDDQGTKREPPCSCAPP